MKADGNGWVVVEGRRPVLEALAAGREMREVLLATGAKGKSAAEVEQAALRRGVPVRRVSREELAGFVRTSSPQGVAAFARPLPYASLDTIIGGVGSKPGLLLICDGVVDPQNLGALIRTVDAAGAHGVVIPKRRAAGLTEAVSKASAGAAEHVPVAQVTNVTRTLEELKDRGYWITGASLKGEIPLWDADLKGPSAIVVGGEGKGLSRLVEESCDFLVTIPMFGVMSSLNASVAGALFLYEAIRQRRGGEPPRP